MNRNHSDKEIGERRAETGELSAPPPVSPLSVSSADVPAAFPVSSVHPSSFILHPVQRASSLITTLLVMVVLSTIVVAFMQSMSVERSVAKSVKNRLNAELAADSGLDLAKQMLSSAIGTNFGYATFATNLGSGLAPVLMIASGSDLRQSLPLVSGPVTNIFPSGATNTAMLSSYLSNAANTNSAFAADANRKMGGYRLITDEAAAPRFNAPWIYVTNSQGVTNARFCFFVTDEQAKLNLAIHGTATNTNRVGWGQGPENIPVAVPGAAAYLTPSILQTNMSNFSTYSLAAIGQAFSNRDEYERKKHLYALNVVPSAEFIPAGYLATNGVFLEYRDANRPKYDLNALATNIAFGITPEARASNIASVIDQNLTNFKTRDIAFVADGKTNMQIRYLERIASSIVDYIDSDTVSTVLSDGEPAGKELAPVITSIAERYNWIGESGSGANWTNIITQTTFVQIWNPYQTNVSGAFGFELFTPSTAPDSSRYRYIQMPGAVQQPMRTVTGTNAVALRPNEYKVYNMGTATNIVITSVQCSLNVTNHPVLNQTASTNTILPLHTRYKATWQNGVMDYTANQSQFFDSRGPGLSKSSVGASAASRITLNGTARFSVNYPQYGFVDPVKGYRAVSDPRQNYLANYVWETPAAGSSDVLWNGRNSSSGVMRQDYNVTWARRDFVRANPPLGTSTGVADPTTAPTTWNAGDASNSIAFIRNAPMQTVAELGNIYDPVQLNDAGFATDAGNPNSWYTSGGGRTLRIAQSEFVYPDTVALPSGSERKSISWNQDALSASSLLDLFTARPTNARGVSEVIGKVNLNTASREVLAALFYGIGQDGDLAFTNSRMTTNGAYIMADAVTNARPFFKISDIKKVYTNALNATNFSPQLGSASTNVAAIMDSGREQVLGSLIASLDTRSQAFNVVVLGEALDSKGRVVSQAAIRAILAVDIIQSPSTANFVLSIKPVYVQSY